MKENIENQKGINMKKYLIMKCEELGDQWECDANREPVCLVDDWQKWAEENHPNYLFEVYEFIDDKKCACIKKYDEAVDEGMALCYWILDEDPDMVSPYVVKKWPGLTREDELPKEVKEAMASGFWDFYGNPETDKYLPSEGYVSWYTVPNAYETPNAKFYVYGKYEDGKYSTAC